MSEFESSPIARNEEIDDVEADDVVEALSPAVRRLVRQYDVDVTGIHGSGPDGRIRVGDVIAVIGGRTHVPTTPQLALQEAEREPRSSTRSSRASAVVTPLAAPASIAESRFPTTTVFECDVSRVLAHQRLMREQGQDVVLTSYFVFACTAALNLLSEMQLENDSANLGLSLTAPDGSAVTAVIRDVQDQSFTAINARLAALLAGGPGAHGEALADSAIVIHHHGLSGSIVAFPTPLAAGRAASVGIGAVRRIIAVRNVNGEDTVRMTAQCYVSLSFDADRIELPQANLFLNECVRTLEHWPVKRTGAQ
jgi:2-oxoglutarate dehydrogenase E2 component (dihydrolipoamide succinyltransferase)